jgi:hypothetical protein
LVVWRLLYRFPRRNLDHREWKPSSLIIVDFNGSRNVGRLREGHFTQDVIGTRARVNISPDLQMNSYLRYDNTTQSLGTNTRLRWTFRPSGICSSYTTITYATFARRLSGEAPGVSHRTSC